MAINDGLIGELKNEAMRRAKFWREFRRKNSIGSRTKNQ